MKKIYTTLALLLVFIAAHAQWNQPQRQNRNRMAQTPYAPAQLVTPAALHLTLSANNNYTITIANQSLNFYGNSFFFENFANKLCPKPLTKSPHKPQTLYPQKPPTLTFPTLKPIYNISDP